MFKLIVDLNDDDDDNDDDGENTAKIHLPSLTIMTTTTKAMRSKMMIMNRQTDGRNEQVSRLASRSDTTSDLQLRLSEVLRDLGRFLSKDRTEHHSTGRTKKKK